MHDTAHYPDPETFDAFRFARKRPNGQRPESSRFTDAKPDWLIWGYGNTTWCAPLCLSLVYGKGKELTGV